MIQKFRMFSAKPEDFDCIMICEDLGLIIEVAYLSGCDQTINGEGKPIVIIEFGYTRPKRFILTAWDIQKGMKIWSSSDQSSKMSVLKTLPQLGLALTYSEDLYIKVWDCSHSDAVASVRMPLPCITLEPFMSKHGSFLMVGDGSGSIYSLLLPKLQAIHKIKVFKYSVDIIKVSPNTKWIFACGIHQTVWPVIIFSEHLQKEKEREIPLLYLKIAPCVEAFWSPKKPNRIIMMRQIFSKITVEFITCDIQTELYGDKSNTQANQVASFLLSDDMGVHFKTGVSNENMIVVENGPVLNIFSIDGVLLQQYTNHKQDISKIWTDSVHVITFSKDNSLHLYMWDERSHSPLLKSCCHLDLGPIDFKEMEDLCLKKWFSCHFIESGDVTSWKQLYFKQMIQKFRMFSAKPGDFDCKIISEDSGSTVDAVYLSGSDQTMAGEGKSIVFVEFVYTWPRKFILTAWDVQKGIKIWSSIPQFSRMSVLRTLSQPQQCLALTYSEDFYVRVWDCFHSSAVAALRMPLRCVTLEPCLTKHGSFLIVGDIAGDIHTLALPELKKTFKVHAFKHTVDILHFSPNNKWIFACGTYQNIWPMVYFSENLLKPTERKPLSLPFQFSPCTAACWAPRRPNRIIMMVRKYSLEKVGFITMEIGIEKSGNQRVIQANQIACFPLPNYMETPCNMGVYNENTIVMENGSVLSLFTVRGIIRQQFHHHQESIVRIWTDSVHVITLSEDSSLHLYMWDERSHPPLLRSCCHLNIIPESRVQMGYQDADADMTTP